MNGILYVPLLLAGLSLAAVGMAADRNAGKAGAYAGGSVGYYRIDDEDFLDEDDDLKDNRSAWRAYGGAQPSGMLAFEGAYTDFGSSSDGIAHTDITGVSAAVLLGVPVIYGKLGMIWWDRDRSFGALTANDDGSDGFYGLGLRFGLADRVTMRVEYERYSFDETDLDMGSLNLQFHF